MLQRSVPDHIVSALKQASFNGTVENEHGKDVLKRLMDNGKRVLRLPSQDFNILVDELRAAVLKCDITTALCTMFRKGDSALNHTAVDFLVIISHYGERSFAYP